MLMVYAEMDRAINESINADLPIDISCKKACSFCCHSHADISTDESELIKLVASANKIDIDCELLKRQSQHDSSNWHKQSWQDRKRVFLDNEPVGICKIYAHRPANCRKLYSSSSLSLCESEDSKSQILRYTVPEAEILSSAIMNVSISLSMPNLLHQSQKNSCKTVFNIF